MPTFLNTPVKNLTPAIIEEGTVRPQELAAAE